MNAAAAQFPFSVCVVQDLSQEIVPPTVDKSSNLSESRKSLTVMSTG